MTELKKSDIRLLETFLRHMGKVFSAMPCMPVGTDTRTYNAYRLARRKEYGQLLKKLETWKNENENEGQ